MGRLTDAFEVGAGVSEEAAAGVAAFFPFFPFFPPVPAKLAHGSSASSPFFKTTPTGSSSTFLKFNSLTPVNTRASSSAPALGTLFISGTLFPYRPLNQPIKTPQSSISREKAGIRASSRRRAISSSRLRDS